MSLPQTYNLLAQHMNPLYVETGIYRGDGLQQAIDANFEYKFGMDIDESCIDFCRHRFDLNRYPRTDVMLYPMDTATGLGPWLTSINNFYPDAAITFFLDAHWQMLEGTEGGDNPFPLLAELRHIAAKRHGRNDTIIIDDMLIMQNNIVGYNASDIANHLALINPNFKIKRVANPVINGILIATP